VLVPTEPDDAIAAQLETSLTAAVCRMFQRDPSASGGPTA
jgi:hypothetical protein